MKPVFQNHCVICGWDTRGKSVVQSLRKLTQRPIVVLHQRADIILQDVGTFEDVFVVQADPADPAVLRSIDIPHAYSVLVLADETLANYSDARSVEIALSVERIQSAVTTVVELRDIRNKINFSWTKVDDLVTSEHIAVCMLAQGIRHTVGEGQHDSSANSSASNFLGSYTQLIDPETAKSQLFRINVPREQVASQTFNDLLERGLQIGVLPVAIVGYKRHEIIDSSLGNKSWVSWKTDVVSLPQSQRTLGSYWSEWPPYHNDMGVLVIARSLQDAKRLVSANRR